jgi:hypothetical protein
MPVALITAILGIINKVVKDPQQQAELQNQMLAELYSYQSDFISKTSDWLNRLLRVAIVAVFSYALMSPSWGRTLAENARAMPVYFWLIIGWEFYGASMLQALPWFKENNSSAVAISVAGNDPLPRPIIPAIPSIPERNGGHES